LQMSSYLVSRRGMKIVWRDTRSKKTCEPDQNKQAM
jgi:hypothetical protein